MAQLGILSTVIFLASVLGWFYQQAPDRVSCRSALGFQGCGRQFANDLTPKTLRDVLVQSLASQSCRGHRPMLVHADLNRMTWVIAAAPSFLTVQPLVITPLRPTFVLLSNLFSLPTRRPDHRTDQTLHNSCNLRSLRG